MDAKEFGKRLQFVGKLLAEGKEVEFRHVLPSTSLVRVNRDWEDLSDNLDWFIGQWETVEFREKLRRPREIWQVIYDDLSHNIYDNKKDLKREIQTCTPTFDGEDPLIKEVIHWREVIEEGK